MITCDACGSAGVLRTSDGGQISARRQFSFLAQQQRIWILPRMMKRSKSYSLRVWHGGMEAETRRGVSLTLWSCFFLFKFQFKSL